MRWKFLKDILKQDLERLGFSMKKEPYEKKINSEFVGTLGFTITSPKNGCIYVNPIVNLINRPVNEILNKLYQKESFLEFSSIGNPIGYLMPDKNYKEWTFEVNGDNSLAKTDLINAINTYANGFYEKFSNIDEMILCMESMRFTTKYQKENCLPILYYLKGDKQKGVDFINNVIESHIDYKPKDIPFKIGEVEKVVVGSGYGKLNPEYLKFAENFKEL